MTTYHIHYEYDPNFDPPYFASTVLPRIQDGQQMKLYAAGASYTLAKERLVRKLQAIERVDRDTPPDGEVTLS